MNQEDAALLEEIVLEMQRRLRLAREALQLIAKMPTSERNPDGDEQAAHSMRQVARDTLSLMGP